MARIFTDNPQSPAALDGATMQTDFFDRRFYFHVLEILGERGELRSSYTLLNRRFAAPRL